MIKQDRVFAEGKEASKRNLNNPEYAHNPYPKDTNEYRRWFMGWNWQSVLMGGSLDDK